MIHIRSPILTTLLIMRMKAVEPPGGCHGTNNKADRCPMGPVGSIANEYGIGRCLSQLYNYFDVPRCDIIVKCWDEFTEKEAQLLSC